MKSPIAFAVIALLIGLISRGVAGPAPVSGAPGGYTTEPVISGTTSSGTGSASSGTSTTGIGTTSSTAGAAPTAPPNENNTDPNDDTLYRGSTRESENPMLRDEGPLHFKTRPKEKIQEVDSLKKLQSSGTDPKFQGTLLNADIDAIEKVSAKAQETQDAAADEDSRFKMKRPTSASDQNDESKKAQSDSSPSPTPSPTPSPAAKKSGAPKQ